jgi:hypothetical protein
VAPSLSASDRTGRPLPVSPASRRYWQAAASEPGQPAVPGRLSPPGTQAGNPTVAALRLPLANLNNCRQSGLARLDYDIIRRACRGFN